MLHEWNLEDAVIIWLRGIIRKSVVTNSGCKIHIQAVGLSRQYQDRC